MKKLWKKLTKEQKRRGIVFSSTLSNSVVENKQNIISEVFYDDEDGNRKIEKLLSYNVDIFWKYNIIRSKELSFYICPFCKEKRNHHNKTEINYQGEWFQGCQNCFMKSIDKVKNFNEREY